MDEIKVLEQCVGFQWDAGNLEKNSHQHDVNTSECEEVFFNKPLILAHDVKHSQQEKRYFLLGQTNEHRRLFLAFTIRKNLILVISARDMRKQEKKFYEQKENT